MGRFGVSPQKEKALLERMEACGLEEADLKEGFVTSGGPGGQHANRSATCVYLKHGPTGLEVKMRRARSQSLNRFFARRRLCELLELAEGRDDTPAERARLKIRRNKARRSRRSRKKHGVESDEGG